MRELIEAIAPMLEPIFKFFVLSVVANFAAGIIIMLTSFGGLMDISGPPAWLFLWLAASILGLAISGIPLLIKDLDF